VDLKLVETFLCVYEERNVTRAAARLSTVQPAVSNQIKRLEEALDLRLFERSTRGLAPTAAGRAVYRLFAPVVADFRAAERQARELAGSPIPRVAVGFSPYVSDAILSDVLHRFRTLQPDVEVGVEEAHSPALIARVADGALDLAIVHFGALSTGIPATLLAVPLIEEDLVLVERDDGGSDAGEPIPFAELALRRLVLPRARHGYRRDVELAAQRARTLLNVDLEINAPGPLLALVAHGTLASIVPAITARKASGHLPIRIRRLVQPSVTRSILCVHRREQALSPLLVEFVRIVRGELAHGADAERMPPEAGTDEVERALRAAWPACAKR